MTDELKIDDGCEEFEQDVDLDTTFTFPQTMTEHNVLGKHLVVAPEYANWLVCDDDEYEVFRSFSAREKRGRGTQLRVGRGGLKPLGPNFGQRICATSCGNRKRDLQNSFSLHN